MRTTFNHKTRKMGWRGWMFLLALCGTLLAGGAQAQERGIGPFFVQTAEGRFPVRLLKRDREKGTVWVLKQAQAGGYFEAGMAPGEIILVEMPRPKFFEAALQPATPEQAAQAQAALKNMADSLKPFRDLPGVLGDEALVLQGRLAEAGGQYPQALKFYEEVLQQPYFSAQAGPARLRAGLCYSALGDPAKAFEYLSDVTVSDEDADLLSEVMLSRGQALAKLGRHQEAVLSLLYLVVFHPYVRDNEARCLSAVLPSYAALKDWDALAKTVQTLEASYPGTPHATNAAAFAATHFPPELKKNVQQRSGSEVTNEKE